MYLFRPLSFYDYYNEWFLVALSMVLWCAHKVFGYRASNHDNKLCSSLSFLLYRATILGITLSWREYWV